jgi:phage I-like protein
MDNALAKYTASLSGSLDGKAPASIVLFPVGKNTAQASKAGKPVSVTVEASEALAAKLDGQLQASIAAAAEGKESRPFIDFEHSGGRAAAHPIRISYDAERGVIAEVEWTPAGRAAVEGKEFSYISPEWLMAGGEVTGLALPGVVAALVNLPAFQTTPKIAASLASMDYYKTEILKILLSVGLITQEQLETIAVEDTVKMVRDMAEEGQAMKAAKSEVEGKFTAALADSEKHTAKISQLESDLTAVKASLASANDALTASKSETEKVKASVNAEVARICHAAGLKTPVNAEKLAASADQSEVTRAVFEKMSPSAQLSHVKAGRKIL